MKPASDSEKFAYGRWGTTALFCLADSAAVIGTGASLQRFCYSGGGAQTNMAGAAATGVAGLVRALLSFFETGRSLDGSWWQFRQFTINLASCIPTLTAPVRTVKDVSPGTPGPYLAMAGKLVVDVAADVYAGGATAAQAVYELKYPPHIENGPAPIALKKGTLNQAYESEPIEVEGGYPHYTWSVLKLSDAEGLPEGLELAAREVAGDKGREVVVRGTPTRAGAFTFSLRVEDAFRPTGVDIVQCNITIETA